MNQENLYCIYIYMKRHHQSVRPIKTNCNMIRGPGQMEFGSRGLDPAGFQNIIGDLQINILEIVNCQGVCYILATSLPGEDDSLFVYEIENNSVGPDPLLTVEGILTGRILQCGGDCYLIAGARLYLLSDPTPTLLYDERFFDTGDVYECDGNCYFIATGNRLDLFYWHISLIDPITPGLSIISERNIDGTNDPLGLDAFLENSESGSFKAEIRQCSSSCYLIISEGTGNFGVNLYFLSGTSLTLLIEYDAEGDGVNKATTRECGGVCYFIAYSDEDPPEVRIWILDDSNTPVKIVEKSGIVGDIFLPQDNNNSFLPTIVECGEACFFYVQTKDFGYPDPNPGTISVWDLGNDQNTTTLLVDGTIDSTMGGGSGFNGETIITECGNDCYLVATNSFDPDRVGVCV